MKKYPIKSIAFQLVINEVHNEDNRERIDNAIEFIEASRLNDMTDEDIIAFLEHFKDRTQSEVIKQLIQFEESFKYLTFTTFNNEGKIPLDSEIKSNG
jgi:hypothetical protein